MWSVSQVPSHSAKGSAGQSARLSDGFKDHLIDVTPGPVLARFQRFYDRVLGGVKVFGGVLVLGRIAATDVAATEAQAQVYPFITHLQAFFAAVSVRFDVANLIDVGTTVHGSILNLDLQQAGGGFSQDRAAISVAESGRLEYFDRRWWCSREMDSRCRA